MIQRDGWMVGVYRLLEQECQCCQFWALLLANSVWNTGISRTHFLLERMFFWVRKAQGDDNQSGWFSARSDTNWEMPSWPWCVHCEP